MYRIPASKVHDVYKCVFHPKYVGWQTSVSNIPNQFLQIFPHISKESHISSHILSQKFLQISGHGSPSWQYSQRSAHREIDAKGVRHLPPAPGHVAPWLCATGAKMLRSRNLHGICRAQKWSHTKTLKILRFVGFLMSPPASIPFF